MADARVERTLASIKGAMLALLEEKRLSEIGMAELAREAGVSRATLYSHYPHTREVFTELVGDFCKHVRSLPAQLRHSECAQACRRPFCMTIRAAGPFQPLVLAPEFMGAYLDYVLNGPEADEALAPYLAAGVTRGTSVLIPRASVARDTLPDALAAAGADVHVMPAYDTVRPESGEATERLVDDLRAGAIDAVTFTSSSTARNFCELLGECVDAGDIPGLLEGVTCASIGPVTSDTMRKLSLPVSVEADTYTIPGLVSALQTALD